MGWLARLFGKPRVTHETPTDPDATFEQLVWLEPNENQFGVRVLDCRPIAESFLSSTTDPASIRFFGSPDALSGEQFRGHFPETAIRVACLLVYPLTTSLADGPVFRAEVMEDKWNVYHFAGVLYFVRSWTGHLQYVATLAPSNSELQVLEVHVWPGNVLGDDTMAVRQVNYLIRSHLFGQTVPHPVPPLPTKKGIAMWSFSQYGRRGLFAALEGADRRA